MNPRIGLALIGTALLLALALTCEDFSDIRLLPQGQALRVPARDANGTGVRLHGNDLRMRMSPPECPPPEMIPC